MTDVCMLCRYALRQLSPLLGGAGGLQGGSSMHVSIEAVKQHLPAERYTVRVQPMRLIMGSSAFLSGIMGLLKLRWMNLFWQRCSNSQAVHAANEGMVTLRCFCAYIAAALIHSCHGILICET